MKCQMWLFDCAWQLGVYIGHPFDYAWLQMHSLFIQLDIWFSVSATKLYKNKSNLWKYKGGNNFYKLIKKISFNFEYHFE